MYGDEASDFRSPQVSKKQHIEILEKSGRLLSFRVTLLWSHGGLKDQIFSCNILYDSQSPKNRTRLMGTTYSTGPPLNSKPKATYPNISALGMWVIELFGPRPELDTTCMHSLIFLRIPIYPKSQKNLNSEPLS